MSNARLFCVGGFCGAVLHAVGKVYGWLSPLALSDMWGSRLCSMALFACLAVAFFGDRK